MQKESLEPKVSVGLPVYNGERYVPQAIESILAQTYVDFELIISDNASTDRTEEICRHYAERDRRVRYYRQPANLGAAANFNRVFELAEGSKYFKWAADDDWIAPTYVEECVRELERSPDALLCQSLVEIVDVDGQPEDTYDHAKVGSGLAQPSDRFGGRLMAHRSCFDIFGVIRTDALASTNLIGSHLSADRTLLLELALCGRFVLVPQYLFFHRDRSGRRNRRGATPREELAWYAPETSGRAAWRTWMLYGNCLRMIRKRVESRAERSRCYLHLLRSLGSRKRWARLMLEPLIVPNPRLFNAFTRLQPPARVGSSLPTASPSAAGKEHENTPRLPAGSP